MSEFCEHGVRWHLTCPKCDYAPRKWHVSPGRLDEIAEGDEYDAEITSMARELRELRALAERAKYGEREG